MGKRYTLQNDEGETFEMGAGLSEVGPGDVVKLKGGRLEKITSIVKNLKGWDSTITTESGRSYGMMNIYAYGKKRNK